MLPGGWLAASDSTSAYLKRIFLPQETDGFPVAPAWLFWERIIGTAVELREDMDMREQPKH